MATNVKIPTNAAKILFAEDLVNYVLSLHTGDFNLPCTAIPYRKFVYNGFNKTIREVVYRILCEMPRFQEKYMLEIYRTGVQHDGLPADSSTFMMYAEQYRQRYFPSGYEIDDVVPYCAEMAILAVDFCKKGCTEAPSLAVGCIVEILEAFDVTNKGWDMLDNGAWKYEYSIPIDLCERIRAQEALND